MDKNFSQKHRRSIRLPEYNYTQSGVYFITICTHKRQCWFGNISEGKVKLNHIGYIVAKLWQGCQKRFNYINIDQFIVMPNHFHGILIINNNEHQLSSQRQFSKPISGSLATIIGSFKSAVTRRINTMRKTPTPPIWQRNYYERIIRNEQELNNVRQYIINNPLKWELDEENPLNSPYIEPIELDFYF